MTLSFAFPLGHAAIGLFSAIAKRYIENTIAKLLLPQPHDTALRVSIYLFDIIFGYFVIDFDIDALIID